MICRQLLPVCVIGFALATPVALAGQGQPKAPVDSILAARGRELADQHACRVCHAYAASEPKAMGPSLNGIFQRRDSAYLDQKLADPRFDDANSLMPKAALTESERRAIVEFLRTLN